MTVADLIARLSELDPTLVVCRTLTIDEAGHDVLIDAKFVDVVARRLLPAHRVMIETDLYHHPESSPDEATREVRVVKLS